MSSRPRVAGSSHRASDEVALFWLYLVLVLNEMVLVLVLDLVINAVSSSTSTSTANAEYEYEKPRDNKDFGTEGFETRNIKTRMRFCEPLARRLGQPNSILQSMRDSSQSRHCRMETRSMTGSPKGGIASCLFPASHVRLASQSPLGATSTRN